MKSFNIAAPHGDGACVSSTRIGVIDIGSNSVRLVVFDGAMQCPVYIHNEKVSCGLGIGLSQTRHLNPAGKPRALAAIERFVALARHMRATPIFAVATAAVRDATDGADFKQQVLDRTGVDISILDGAAEARLSAQGVLLGWPDAQGVMCDMGGSSVELATLDGRGGIGGGQTSNLGPFKLMAMREQGKNLRPYIKKAVETLVADFPVRPPHLFLVGGSWRAIGKVDMARRDYPLTLTHGYRMTPRAISATIAHIATADPDSLRAQAGINETRMRLLPLAADVLGQIVRTLKPRAVMISSYGLREGLLYKHIGATTHRTDPLIAAASMAEAHAARQPGFGAALYDFIAPLFPRATPAKHRLIRAACLLHDVNWHVRAAYRADMCFNIALQESFGDLTHGQRVYLSLALLHRYKSNWATKMIDARIPALLPQAEVVQAEILGRAMRFGAAFGAATPCAHATLTHRPKRHELILNIKTEEGQTLLGDRPRARFKALATAMGAEPIIDAR